MKAFVGIIASLVFAVVYVAMGVWAFIMVYGWLTFFGMLAVSVISTVWWCGALGLRRKTELEQLVNDVAAGGKSAIPPSKE